MNKILIVLIALGLMLTSCSHFISESGHSRYPADTGITIEDVLTFKKSNMVVPTSYRTNFDNQLSAYNIYTKVKTVIELDKNMSEDISFKVNLTLENNQYIIKVLHSKNAFNDVASTQSLMMFLAHLTPTERINTPYSLFEMFYNAKLGDVESLQNLLKLRTVNNTQKTVGLLDPKLSQEAIQSEISENTKEIASKLSQAVTKVEKERKDKKAARKQIIDALDKAADDNQFRTLVAKNDRKGVAQLLKKYLPFEDMAPFEKKYWDDYLEILQNPIPHHERILIYRGIDDDVIHVGYKNGVALEKEEAIKEANAFVMSTLVVKNQGTWNRRLRSLETMEEKFIGTVGGSNEFSRSARITTMFKAHSGDPKGSPFLSFTPSTEVANRFGHKKSSAYLIDPRLLQFNFTSGFTSEKEFLMPLTTFPDDLVTIWVGGTDPNEYDKFFDDKLVNLIEAKYGKADRDAIVSEIKKNSYDFFNPVYKTITDETKVPKTTYLGTIADFFKSFFGNKKEPLPTMDDTGNLKCDDLIKAFWK